MKGASVPEKKVDVIETGGRARRGAAVLDLAHDVKLSTERLESFAFAKWEPVLCDALVLAAGVEFADRVQKRPDSGWTRRLSLRVPVHDTQRWSGLEVSTSLHEALERLTGDYWDVEFVQRKSEAPTPPQDYLALGVPTKAVLAYSDGMDSRAVNGLLRAEHGAQIIRVRVGPKRWDAMNGSREPFTAVPYDVPANMSNREPSSRSRGFKFALISGIAAYLTGSPEIVIPESGQGAIGPALAQPGHIYADYRNHPIFTVRIERFLKALLGWEGRFVFPRLWDTKGETLRAFVDLPGISDWQSTRSCWRNNQWSSVNGMLRQCGVCAACMLRRLSVHAAGQQEAPTVYVCEDLSAQTVQQGLNSAYTRWTSAFDQYGIAGTLHMQHLADMASADARCEVKCHAHALAKALRIEPQDAEKRLASLLERHALEWSNFVESLGQNSFISQWTGR